jgi:hypothetical protein
LVQRLPLILGAAVLGGLALAEPAAHATCKPTAEDRTSGAARIYDGAIGGEPARLALVFGKDGAIEGRYALATSPEDVVVRGRIEPDAERMTLSGLDGAGQPRAVLEGVWSEKKVTFEAPPGPGALRKEGAFYVPTPSIPPATYQNMNCYLLLGSLSENGGAPRAVNLTSARMLEHPSFGHLYALAGAADDEVVNRRAQAFRQAVVDGDPEEAARHIRLPMTFSVRGKLVVIANAKDLRARFDDIFPQPTRDAIRKLVPRMMQVTEAGIMLTPTMWFDKEGYLIAF